MTKSLTEQWEDGELEEGYYYVLVKDFLVKGDSEIIIDEYATWYGGKGGNGKPKKEFTYSASIEEVLAPVPIYEDFLIHRDYCKDHQKLLIENMNLKKQLEIAKKALDCYKTDVLGEPYISRLATKTLKEMESVNEND